MLLLHYLQHSAQNFKYYIRHNSNFSAYVDASHIQSYSINEYKD